MAARNKIPEYKCYDGKTTPIFLNLPVQAGSTQAIKQGEICKLRDYTDIASYPIIPVSTNDVGFIPLIAWEEQAATDPARLMKFMLPTPNIAVEFALNAATQVKCGDKIQIQDSQTVKVSAAYTVGSALIEPTDATPTWQSITSVFVTFGYVRAETLKHFPFIGGAVAGSLGDLSDMGDVGVLAYTAGKIIVADGNSYEEVAVSGDATLGLTGALTLVKKTTAEAIADPGNTVKAIPITNSGYCPLVTAGAETRTVAIPTFAGQQLLLELKTDGGDCAVTFASAFNQAGNTVITFDDAGDMALFIGVYNGANLAWRLVGQEGCVGITGDKSDLDTVITDPGASGAIPVTSSGNCALVSAGAEARTLAIPTYLGQAILLHMKTDNGAITVTVAQAINAAGRTTLVFDDTGDHALLVAVNLGSALRWRVVSSEGIEGLDIGAIDLDETASAEAGVPVLIHKICSAATGGGDNTVWTATRKVKVVDAWMVARDTNAANITLKNGSSAFTGAVAKGGTDDARVAFDKIIAEYDEVAAAGTIVATFSAIGAADIFVLAIPIA